MQTIILGLDAFDPGVFEQLQTQGKLPNLAALAQAGGYARFEVTSPPQSEVSWTSIATGLDPAGHGLFDFVHRDPKTYHLSVSLLPTQQTRLGIEFVRPYEAHTLFDEAAEQGYLATALWWPATFPARLDSPVRNIPGLGTPDIHGRLGVGVNFTSEPRQPGSEYKIPVFQLSPKGRQTFTGSLAGPAQQKAGDAKTVSLEFELSFLDQNQARLQFGKQRVDLKQGTWSPILEISFRMGFLVSVRAITRVILTEGLPSPRLYFLPLQIHPLHPLWRYATPPGFVKQTWQQSGGFLSLGWPQDTTALEEGHITDEQFLALCDQIFETRKAIFLHQVEQFQEGVLASVFDTLDRVQHMFWRDRPDVLEHWYKKLDHLAGEVTNILRGQKKTRLLVVSDHGFTDFTYKVHVNQWLEAQGYLVRKSDLQPGNSLANADWSKTRAYAVGLNSLYLNLQAREGEGCVPSSEKENLQRELQQKLLDWTGPDGKAVFQAVQPTQDMYDGPYFSLAPDLFLGFSPGYRASAETGLGKWDEVPVEHNHDHWGADHCIHAGAVPGVLFSNQSLNLFPRPSFRDFPEMAIGMKPKVKAFKPHARLNPDNQTDIEERLKGLGYL